MNKQDFMKLQTCVLKVNLQCACEGCSQKIKKLLNKIDGVYRTSIDLDQGKVTVYGDANPTTLIKKLNKSGKHAELWGSKKGFNLLNNQFKNMGFDNKNHTGGGKDKQKGGKGYQQMQSTINKGLRDIKSSNKEQKSVKFNMPPVRGGGGGFDDDDDDCEFDDDFDDEDSDSYDGYDDKKPNKMMMGPKVGGYGPNGPVAMMNGMKGTNAGYEMQFKGKGGYNDFKKGNGGKKGGKGGGGDNRGGKISKNEGDGFFGGMIGRALFGGGKKKHGVSSPKGGKKGVDGGGREQKGGNWDKKGGKHHDEGKFGNSNKGNEFLDFSKSQNGGGGRNMGHNSGNSGRNIGGNPIMAQMRNHPMGHMGGYQMGPIPSGQGLPMGYRGQGMDHGNPYNQHQYQQQQYMQGMMMNQQRANMYPQMMYGQLPPAAYGPPMGGHVNDNMSHMFSDENTEGCSIM